MTAVPFSIATAGNGWNSRRAERRYSRVANGDKDVRCDITKGCGALVRALWICELSLKVKVWSGNINEETINGDYMKETKGRLICSSPCCFWT